jgi:sulfite reductase (NADPH) flavoprotein alpha-component
MQDPPLPALVRALRALHLDGAETAGSLLSASEAAWLSGYFAALARDPAQRAELARALLPEAAPLSPAPARPRVRVLYATETGNAAGLARQAAARLGASGLEADVLDLADYSPRTLESEHTVVLVTSTHGDGTPPEPAAPFFEGLMGSRAPRSLAKLRFAVLGLGDSSYEHFCRAARMLDERLGELGAERLLPRVDCDVEYEGRAASWTDDLVALLGALTGGSQPARGSASAMMVAPSSAAASHLDEVTHDKRRPFEADVIENFRLTGRGSSKEVRHVALDLGGSGLAFTPGDALGVCAPNHASVVDALLRALRLSGEEQVAVEAERITLRRALTERLDVTVPTARFLDAWAERSGAQELRALAGDDEARRRFLRAHHVLDIVQKVPAAAVADADEIVRLLRPLAPRLYSIASSQAALPTEVHLTVSVVRYEQHARQCLGVASGHIAEQAGEGQRLRVYVHANPSFRLPATNGAPILMIGAGTGVAPYRAFLQELVARGATGRRWLFFGDRNFRTDFLYQTEWQAWLRAGALTRLSVAFSRDQAEKTYVQQRIVEQGREVYAWLEEGAHVYVCGDAQAMAPAVHEALITVIARQRGSRDLALDYLHALRDQRRYQRDVY